MSAQQVTVQFQIQYRNSSGDIDFSGANYRIVDRRVLRTGKADKDGETAKATVKKGEKIYLELKDISTNTWESPNPHKRMGFTATKSGQKGTVLVSNCYFQAKLTTNKWITFKKPWKYEVILKGDNNKTITLKGVLNEEGKTKIYDSQKMPMAKQHENTAKIRFNQLALSSQPNVKVVFIEPITGERFPDSKRVIPVGADKKYREFQIKMSSNVTASITSQLKLQKKKDSRTIILDIDITAGATYTITREDNKEFFDNKLEETKKSDFKDGTPHTIYIPKKYNGKILLKKGSKIIAKFPLEALDPNKKNAPIVFCLSNKSTPVAKQKVSVDNIDRTEPMVWNLESKTSIAKGEYNIDRENISDNEFLVLKSVLSSLAFDGLVLPGATETQNILKNNNRQFVWDALRKLKVGVSKVGGKDVEKKGILRFDVRTINMKGVTKTVIVFKGYSGHRSFLKKEFYPLANSKVGMLSGAGNVKAAVTAGGYGAGGLAAVKSTAKGLGPFGIGLVATFDIAEFLLTDDWKNNFSDLYVTLGIDLTKAAIATFAGVVLSALVIGSGIGVVVVGVGIIAAVATSFILEGADRKYNVTQKAQNMVNYLESSNMKYLEANKSL